MASMLFDSPEYIMSTLKIISLFLQAKLLEIDLADFLIYDEPPPGKQKF